MITMARKINAHHLKVAISILKSLLIDGRNKLSRTILFRDYFKDVEDLKLIPKALVIKNRLKNVRL